MFYHALLLQTQDKDLTLKESFMSPANASRQIRNHRVGNNIIAKK